MKFYYEVLLPRWLILAGCVIPLIRHIAVFVSIMIQTV